MKFALKTGGRCVAALLLASIMLPSFALSARAQNGSDEPDRKRVVIVNAEQPNVWTLEQAHYLLAQMHRRNLDLKATGLGDLDPNEINGLNFEVLKTLLDFGVAFDDAARFKNSLLKSRQSFDANRALRLQKRRDELADESLALTREIARLQRQEALAKSQEEKDNLKAEIAERTAVRDALDKEVARIDNDLKTAGGPTGEVTATEPPAAEASRLPQTVFDDSFKSITKELIDRFNQSPKLNATLRLENFLQMQYEIIAKQLTLLRDEVGPGERIIFLEMPQTVNAAHDKANKMWAQSWWKVAGYTTLINGVSNNRQRSLQRMDAGDQASQGSGNAAQGAAGTTPSNQPDGEEPITMRKVVRDAMKALGRTAVDDDGKPQRVKYVPLASDGDKLLFEDRTVRTIELIPRQSSLNVNDIKLRARTGMLTAVAKTLFGFGARLNVQRQRETFSQFVQQELYSSGFGKGAREFGWTFNPMPGTDRVMSGARTTYAVMVVPVEAEALVLHSTGCYFPRSEYEPNNFANTSDPRWTDPHKQGRNCTKPKAFIVPIPGGGDEQNYDFWVDALEYVPAPKGGRVVLSIYGRNFPSQIGMMVDGVPLTQSIGVAQPLIRDDSAAFRDASTDLKTAGLTGSIERIDANQIVAVFDRPNGKDGTQPTITLTAPGKAKIINTLKLFIRTAKKKGDMTLDQAELMFGKREAEKEPFRIEKLEVFRGKAPGILRAVISGAGFQDAAGNTMLSRVLINGHLPLRYWIDSPTLLRAEFNIPSDETISVTLVSPDPVPGKAPDPDPTTIESDAVANPARLKVTGVEVVSFEAATEEEDANLVVRITGSGFSDDLRAFIDEKAVEIVVKSATEALLNIKDPKAASVVVLKDEMTGLETKTIVTRKTRPSQ